MKHFKAALQFLTLLPLGRSDVFDTQKLIPYFPVVGLIVGLLLAGFDVTVSRFWPQPTVAVMDIVFLVLVTGAFHLDGLADAADGLLGHRLREKALEIMKDSRIGAMGLMAVVCCLAVKWAGIQCLTGSERILFLIVIPAYSRSGMMFGMRFLPYGRTTGTGLSFFEHSLTTADFKWILLPLAVSMLLGWRGIWLNMAFAAMMAVIMGYYRRRMGCITGDMLGAITEVMEAVLFLFMAARWQG